MLYWLAFLSSAEPVKRFRMQLTMLDPSFNASDQWKWESGCQKNNPWKAYRFEYEFTECSNKSFNQKRRSNFRFFYFQLTKAHHLAKFRRSFICTRSQKLFSHIHPYITDERLVSTFVFFFFVFARVIHFKFWFGSGPNLHVSSQLRIMFYDPTWKTESWKVFSFKAHSQSIYVW